MSGESTRERTESRGRKRNISLEEEGEDLKGQLLGGREEEDGLTLFLENLRTLKEGCALAAPLWPLKDELSPVFQEGEEEEERRGDEAVTPAQGEVSSKGAPSRWGQGADQETILFEELGGEAHLFSKAFEEEAELFLDLPKTEGEGSVRGGACSRKPKPRWWEVKRVLRRRG